MKKRNLAAKRIKEDYAVNVASARKTSKQTKKKK